VYAAGGASLLVPLPGGGKETPLRLQAFVNAGRLVALKKARRDEDGKRKESIGDSSEVMDRVLKTVKGLRNELPSAAAGLGLVYAHPMARFELNFTLPLVVRQEEQPRKGIQFGIGVTFL